MFLTKIRETRGTGRRSQTRHSSSLQAEVQRGGNERGDRQEERFGSLYRRRIAFWTPGNVCILLSKEGIISLCCSPCVDEYRTHPSTLKVLVRRFR